MRLRKRFDIIYHTLFVSYGNTWGGESADDPPERRKMETKLWEHALAVNLNMAKRHCQKMNSITFRGISPCDVCEIKKICIGIDRGIKSGKVDGVSKSLLSMKDIEIPKTGRVCRKCGATYEINHEFEKRVAQGDGMCPACKINSLLKAAEESGVIGVTFGDSDATIRYR